MNNILYRILLLALAAVLSGCGNSPTSSPVYEDSLTFGTGRHGLDLTGVTNTFAGNLVTVYWRVESRDPLNGAVEFVLEKKNGVQYETVYRFPDNLVGQNDHVLISSFYNVYGTGTFRATAYVGAAKKPISPAEFVVTP
jgi:hypothetical protein